MKRTAIMIALLALAVVGCSEESAVVTPDNTSAAGHGNPAEKQGGGGSPQLDCNDLLAPVNFGDPGGLNPYFDMAIAACNEQNSNVAYAYGHVHTAPSDTDVSYFMRWQHTDFDTVWTYSYVDICQDFTGTTTPEPIITPDIVSLHAGEVLTALHNRSEMVWDVTCETWPDGGFYIYFYYLDQLDRTRVFSMKLEISDYYIPHQN